MDIKAFDAAKAYGAAMGGAAGGAAGASGQGSAFGAMVESLVKDAASAVSGSEATSAAAIAGKADLVDVVTAVSNAEMVLETVTTVRDRMITAYQEIMRMQL